MPIVINDIPSADAELRALVFSPPATLPDHLKDALREIEAANPSPVDRIVKSGEALFANLEELTKAAKQVGVGLVALATDAGWHGLREDNRGLRIVKAFRRELGEEPALAPWPTREEDPAPLPAYVPKVEAPAPDAAG